MALIVENSGILFKSVLMAVFCKGKECFVNGTFFVSSKPDIKVRAASRIFRYLQCSSLGRPVFDDTGPRSLGVRVFLSVGFHFLQLALPLSPTCTAAALYSKLSWSDSMLISSNFMSLATSRTCVPLRCPSPTRTPCLRCLFLTPLLMFLLCLLQHLSFLVVCLPCQLSDVEVNTPRMMPIFQEKLEHQLYLFCWHCNH